MLTSKKQMAEDSARMWVLQSMIFATINALMGQPLKKKERVQCERITRWTCECSNLLTNDGKYIKKPSVPAKRRHARAVDTVHAVLVKHQLGFPACVYLCAWQVNEGWGMLRIHDRGMETVRAWRYLETTLRTLAVMLTPGYCSAHRAGAEDLLWEYTTPAAEELWSAIWD